jgi:hypothetical protein
MGPVEPRTARFKVPTRRLVNPKRAASRSLKVSSTR